MAEIKIPEYNTCKSSEIIAFCKAKGQADKDWLKEVSPSCKTFFQLRKQFYLRYAPEMLPTKKNKGYKDIIAAL